MNNQKVSIIVLNYNGLRFLKACLASIKAQSYSNIETIVIDNNSNDGSLEFLQKYSWIKLIRNTYNYGYAKANNIGAKKAKGEFLLFLNNDTELFPDMIQELLRNYKEKTILAPAQILSQDKKFDSVGMAGYGADIFGYPYVKEDLHRTKVFYADGAAIFIKKNDFFKIGMFDEKLFIFQEDIDLSWRSQIMGYKIMQCMDAKFYHYSGGIVGGGSKVDKKGQYKTSYFRRYHNEKNVIRNILKNYSLFFCCAILFFLFFIHFFEIIIFSIVFQWKLAGCYFKAYSWNLANIKDTLKYRRDIQSKRNVSDFSLIKRMYFSYYKFFAFIKLGLPKIY